MLVLAVSGCNEMRTATDLHVSRMDEARASYGRHISYMVDNAIMNDMSVADIHFVRHTSELNSTGTARLDRMARLLDVYGGQVRYEATSPDDEIVKERIEHIREYLVLAGCSMERIDVAVMRAGGRGMPGQEAVRKYQESLTRDGSGESGDSTSNAAGFPGVMGGG